MDGYKPSSVNADDVRASLLGMKQADSATPLMRTVVPEYKSIKSRIETLITSAELPTDAIEN